MTGTIFREIPPSVSSHMTLGTTARLKELRKRSIGQSESVAKMKCSHPVSEFLNEKVRAFNWELEYIECAKAGLNEARDNAVSAEHYVEALQPFLSVITRTTREMAIVMGQKKIIEEDLIEEAKKRIRTGEPPIGLLQRAYENTIVPKAMSASAKQHKSRFNQSKFRKEVAQYYGVAGTGDGYCHLTGVWPSRDIKAAHLVPKSMSADELCDLFGVGELVLSDPRTPCIREWQVLSSS